MVVDLLMRAAIGGALFAAIVWLLVRWLQCLSPTIRAMLWWMAAAKFVIALSWITPVQLQVLPATTHALGTHAQSAEIATPLAVDASAPASRSSSGLDLSRLLVGLWAIGVAMSFALAAKRWTHRRHVVRASVRADAEIQQATRAVAAILRVHRVPEVRLALGIDSPFVMGIRNPVVLIPTRFSTMSHEQQRMALCHELAHVKRGDLWLGMVPAIAERVFFFHPLARIAAREYAFWREVACDAVVLARLETPPQAYGRLLLDLGVTPGRATFAPGGAAWSFSSLKRRIVMLQQPSRPRTMLRATAVAVVALAIVSLVPFRLVAREAAMVPATSSPIAQELHDASLQHAGAVRAFLETGLRAILDRRAGRTPLEPAQSRTPPRDREIRFVYMTDDTTTMSGSSGDVARARRLRAGSEDLLWFAVNGKEYVIRDGNVLREISAIWQPVRIIGDEQSEIGARQSEIGTRQSEIGTRQASIGAEQAKIGARQAEIGARQAALAARQAARPTDAERTEIERQWKTLDNDMRALDGLMRELNEKMRALDTPMADLGQDMEALGREMNALGRKMEDAQSKAEADMRALVERAIASGAAQIVR
jgi:bla regulator protein blaR1